MAPVDNRSGCLLQSIWRELLPARAISLAVAGVFVFSGIMPVSAQQGHYEFVPGSRQARWVPGPAPQSGATSNGAASGYPQSRYTQSGYPQSAGQAGAGQVGAGQVSNYVQGRGRRGFIIDAATGQMYTGASVGGYPPQNVRAVPASTPGVIQSQSVRPTATAATSSTNSVKSGAAARSRDYMDSVVVDGVSRSFMVHLPPGYNGTRALPVVMAFHGLGMNSTMMYGLTGFTGLADRKNFIVVFPNSAAGRFQDGLAQGPDDVSFVRAMLDKLQRSLSVDSKRIYACGISNGGYFTQLLALAMPERIAACGVVAATLTSGAQAYAGGGRGVPIVFFEGVDDPLLPWGDGRNKDLGKLGEALGISSLGSIDSPLAKMGGLNSVPDTINFWTSNNHAPASAQVTALPDRAPGDGTRVEMHSYGSGASQVLLYRIEGGGHTWPGALNIKAVSGISGNISQDIDATELMWDFFSRHSS